MEESEKRRERLKAMRMEAAQAGVDNAPETSGLLSGGLSNPLIESEAISTTPYQYNYPRFDYYTDPMAAFSGNRRTNNISPQISQGHYCMPTRSPYQGMIPSTVHQNPSLNFPGSRTFQAPATHFNPGPPRSPMEAASPFGRPQGPRPWVGSGGTFNYGTPPNFYGGSNNFTSPSFDQGNSPVSYNRGRGQRYDNGPHYGSGRGGGRFPDSGRGRGRSRGRSMSPGSGPSGGRGAGSHKSISAELRPDLYYSKQMVEDPWEYLTPVIWKSVEARYDDKSLSKSISKKKTKVSPESSKIPMSQPSLAEYLAASFNESTNEPVADEQGT